MEIQIADDPGVEFGAPLFQSIKDAMRRIYYEKQKLDSVRDQKARSTQKKLRGKKGRKNSRC